jgi:hypothetical protein
MIIRILGEGQYDVPDAHLEGLNTLDSRLQTAVEHDDQTGFTAALSDLLAAVRGVGTALPDSALTGSDLILPAADAGLHEVLALLADDGLIPG